MSSLLVYMPALNEAKTIASVLNSIPKKIEGITKIHLLVVNDGSSDNTEEEALGAGAQVINHKTNKGVGVAFQTAVNYALKIEATILASIDADGQFDVNQIQEMVSPIVHEEVDFCIGNRFHGIKPQNMPSIKYFGNKKVNSIVSFICKEKIEDASCGFRAYSRKALINLNLLGDFTYTHETILDLLNKGFTVKQIPVKVTYFDDRVSRVANNVISYGFKTSKIILKCFRNYKPFYFFGGIALFFFSIAMLLAIFVLTHWLSTGYITPYKSLGILSLILFLTSILFLVLALLADMLGGIRQNQEKILLLTKLHLYDRD